MIKHAVASDLLRRWDTLLHEQGSEITALRDSGVGEGRIDLLYPAGPENYTRALTRLLSSPLAFARLHRRFKPDAASLRASSTGWSLWFPPELSGPPFASKTILIDASETAALEAFLMRSQFRSFKRWGRAAHEFCASLYVLPQLLREFRDSDVASVHHFTLGGAKPAKAITASQFTADVSLLLETAQRTLT